jgi:hypothetical protein
MLRAGKQLLLITAALTSRCNYMKRVQIKTLCNQRSD